MSKNEKMLCEVSCPHGGVCTLAVGHAGDHKALYAYAEPDGGYWCKLSDS